MLRFIFGFLLICYLLNDSYGQGSLRKGDASQLMDYPRGNIQECNAPSHVFKESILQLSSRDDLVMHDRVSQEYIHHVIFVIKQRNMEELTRILHDVSNPTSTNYGQHMSREQVVEMTSNPEARDAVLTYLDSKGASVISETLGGEYITASAPISVWESILNTEFYSFHQTQYNGRVDKLVRAAKYSIPKGLDKHVESVFNTIQMPLQLFGSMPVLIPNANSNPGNVSSRSYDLSGTITPARLKSYYNIGSNQGSALSTQAVFATISQYFSPADLVLFQSLHGLDIQVVDNAIGNHTTASNAKCSKSPDSCSEANLDVQYIMGVSPASPTTFWYSDLSLSDWLVTVAAASDLPLVLSISYGAEEPSTSSSEMTAFNTQIIKLSAMGITVVAASGDDGAVSRKVRTKGSTACGYMSVFPASNPYVIAVGATSGVDAGTAEVVCQANLGKAVTSGGGFSTFYDRPAYQSAAVEGYFFLSTAVKQTPFKGFKSSGRGYPDISLAGYAYSVVIGQKSYITSGTSAAAPAVAGMFSNINAARLAVGKGSLGWVNPSLYANSSLYANDIISGNNKCAADGTCCKQGYYAAPGWDPATGLGSVDYAKLLAVLLPLGITNKAYAATAASTGKGLASKDVATIVVISVLVFLALLCVCLGLSCCHRRCLSGRSDTHSVLILPPGNL